MTSDPRTDDVSVLVIRVWRDAGGPLIGRLVGRGDVVDDQTTESSYACGVPQILELTRAWLLAREARPTDT